MDNILECIKFVKGNILILTIIIFVSSVIMRFMYYEEFCLVHLCLKSNFEYLFYSLEWELFENLLKPFFIILFKLILLLEAVRGLLVLGGDVLNTIRNIAVGSFVCSGCIIVLGDIFKLWTLYGTVFPKFDDMIFRNYPGHIFIMCIIFLAIYTIIDERKKL